jgi:hypothetical protein
MNFTHCPTQPEQFNSPHFDRYQFAGERGRFLKGAKLDFKDTGRMHVLRISNEQKGRRTGVPAWALSNQSVREVVLHYLTTRFAVKDTKGSLQQRLASCTTAGKKRARKEKQRNEEQIREYRAIYGQRFHDLEPEKYERLFCSLYKGESVSERLKKVELQILNSESAAFISDRAAAIAVSVCYYAYRMGWPSPSIAEELNLRAPAVRQILHRLNRAARRLEKGWNPRGRPLRKVSGD